MYLERGFVYGVKGIKWQYVRVLPMGNFLASIPRRVFSALLR